VDIEPPKFLVSINSNEFFHFSYWRFLENKIREYFGFGGTVIDIEVKEKEKKK
jgi:GTP-binding protein